MYDVSVGCACVGLGWHGLRGFFNPTYHGGLKKIQLNPTQPNSHESGWVRLNLWVGFFFYYYYY